MLNKKEQLLKMKYIKVTIEGAMFMFNPFILPYISGMHPFAAPEASGYRGSSSRSITREKTSRSTPSLCKRISSVFHNCFKRNRNYANLDETKEN